MAPPSSKIFVPCRGLGYVSNHIPLKVRYIKSRKENLVVTCVGKSFHTYGISHFGLLSVSGLHPSDITCLEVDAYHVYTSCDNIIYAWRRGTELKHTYRGHKKLVHLMLAFGIHLISVDESSVLKVWDIKSETLFLELTFNNDSFRITTILHPATYINKILLGSDQGALQLWNINTSKLIYTFKGWKCSVSCLEQAPASDVVAVGLTNGKIILHNLKFDKTIMEFIQDWGVVSSITFRTDGHPVMATGGVTGHIVFWNLEERKVSSQLLCAHDATINGMICLPSEPLILTSSPDNTVKLWIFDMPDDGARLLRKREGHSAPPTFVRYHGSNGHNILSAAGDSTLRIFNTQTEMFNKSLGKASYNRKASKKRGRAVEDPLKMPPITEFSAEVTREKDWDNVAAIHLGLPVVTTWSYDKVKMGSLKLMPKKFPGGLNVDVVATCLCLTHCGNFVIIGYSSGHVNRFNMQSGIWRDCYGNPKAHDSSVQGVAADSLNQITITGGSDCKLKFWSFKNKGTMAMKIINLKESIHFFRTHQDHSMLAAVLIDFSILIVDIDTKSIVRKFIGHTAQITDATFSPNSRWLITSSMDCSIRTWDVVSAQLIDQFRTETACISLSMSPTGDALVTAHVDFLGLFLWSNKTLYSRTTLRALSPEEEPPLMILPEVQLEASDEADVTDDDQQELEFISSEQISKELVTLSGLSSSRWHNLLQINEIRQRNKPKQPPKAPKAAPFFLPTIPSLNIQFDIKQSETNAGSKLLMPASLINLSEFGKLLEKTKNTKDFAEVIEKLKLLGPSMIDFEIKSLGPEEGGSIEVMLQFFELIKFMLTSNQNFELAQAYLGVFLKTHGVTIASEKSLRNCLHDVQSCLSVTWNRIQEKLLYCSCVVQNLKIM